MACPLQMSDIRCSVPRPGKTAPQGPSRPMARWRHPMNPSRGTPLTLSLLVALLAGCAQRGDLTGPQAGTDATDQAEVASAVTAEPSYVDDEVSESSDQTTLD